MTVFADIQFPASVSATAPIKITISGNTYTFGFDPAALIASGESLGLVKAGDLLGISSDGTIDLTSDLQARFSYFGSIKSFVTTPPTSPAEGDRYIIATGATLAFAGYVNHLAEWRNGAWSYTAPNSKMLYVAEADHRAYVWTSAAWVSIAEGRLTVALESDLAGIIGAGANTQAEVISDVVATTTHRARASNVATLTTASAHGLSVGDFVNVRGLGGTGYNGRVECITGTTGSTIVYASTGANEGSTADTGGQVDRNGVYTYDGVSNWAWLDDISLAALEARMDALYAANEATIAAMVADANNDVSTAITAMETQINDLVADASSLLFVRDAIFSPQAKPSRGTLKALWYADGPKTFYATDIVSTLTSIDANARVLGLHSTLFSGADPRPVVQDKGIYFNNQAGLSIASGILTKTDKFALHHVFEIGVTNTYTLKADMDAAGGTEGDIAQVTGDTITTYTPDITKVFEGGYADANLVRGFYIRNVSSWSTNNVIFELFAFTSTDGKYMKAYLNRLGQITFQMYNGTIIVTVQSKATVVVGNGRHQMSIFRDASGTHMFLDGVEIGYDESVVKSFGVVTGQINITNLANFYINGDSRGVNPANPVNGVRHWFTAFAVIDDCSWDGFQMSHDAIANYAGTARLDNRPEVWGIAKSGQSWGQGSIDTSSDTWTNPNGWNGMVTRENTSNSGEHNSLTREFLPGVFAHALPSNNDSIGPMTIETNLFGNITKTNGFSSSGETIEWGMMKWLTNHAAAPRVDWLLTNASAGGNTIANLSAESSPPILVQALKSYNEGASPNVITTYEMLLQSIVAARDWAIARGKRYKLKFFIWQQGHSDTSNTNYVTDFFAYYDKFNAAVKRITGQSDDVMCFIPQISYSSDGTNNRGVSASAYIDQLFLDIIDQRGTRPIYNVGPMYQITNHIHPYRLAYRWIGEIFGKIISRIAFEGVDWQPVRPKTFTLGANYVDIKYWLMPSRQLQFVASNNNNINGVVQTSGIDTYGYEYSGGGLTITGVTIRTTTTTNDTVRVSLSGAPAAGHEIKYTGSRRFGNLCDDDPAVAYYKDQDWTQPLVSGAPVYKEGQLNDLRNWGCAFRKVL
jgi:hypothetical protein